MESELLRQVLSIEFQMFQAVPNQGGRAPCQDDLTTFRIMRSSQFSVWPEELLQSYREDLNAAVWMGRNLMWEKYAWMMEETHPEEFSALRSHLPVLSRQEEALIEAIIALQAPMAAALYAQFPRTCAGSRPLSPDPGRPGFTASTTYLRGELRTYSHRTLSLYLSLLQKAQKSGRNLPREILEETARQYGYSSLSARESYLALQYPHDPEQPQNAAPPG